MWGRDIGQVESRWNAEDSTYRQVWNYIKEPTLNAADKKQIPAHLQLMCVCRHI